LVVAVGHHYYAAIAVVEGWAGLVGDGVGDEAWNLSWAYVVELQALFYVRASLEAEERGAFADAEENPGIRRWLGRCRCRWG